MSTHLPTGQSQTVVRGKSHVILSKHGAWHDAFRQLVNEGWHERTIRSFEKESQRLARHHFVGLIGDFWHRSHRYGIIRIQNDQARDIGLGQH